MKRTFYQHNRARSPEETLSTISDISTRTKWLISKRYVQAVIIIGLVTLGVAVPFLHSALALTDVGCTQSNTQNCVFELDGNISKESSGTFPTDWAALFAANRTKLPLPPGGLDSSFVNDAITPDTTVFNTGSKDTLDLPNSGWTCTAKNTITPKDKILDVYSFAIIPSFGPRHGHLMIYAGYERFSNSGAGDIGIWLFQDPTVNCSTPSGTKQFTGAHVINDTLLTAEFTTGGTVTTLDAFKWVGSASPINLANITSSGRADCASALATDNFCAKSNSAAITAPWNVTVEKSPAPGTLNTAEFFELGIDLTAIFGPNPPCINRFLFDSRASPSPTADLHDFAVGSLSTCPTSHISTGVSPSVAVLGGSATDTANVTNTPSSFTVSGTVDFKVYGPVSTNTPTCTTLAASFSGIPIGPSPSPAIVSSPSFTPTATGFYFWTASYTPTGLRNGTPVSTKCGDGGETLVVSTIPKITAFGFTNTPTNNDPTLGSGTVVYTVTIHNYGIVNVQLNGTLQVSGTATVTCTGGNLLPLVGSLAGGADKTFSVTCTYSGNSGQNVQASINDIFILDGVIGAVSGSPTTYTFTIQKL